MSGGGHAVTLRAAEPAQWPAIENLLQFYFYELSAWYPIRFGEDGRYPIGAKHDYLGRPGTHAWAGSSPASPPRRRPPRPTTPGATDGGAGRKRSR